MGDSLAQSHTADRRAGAAHSKAMWPPFPPQVSPPAPCSPHDDSEPSLGRHPWAPVNFGHQEGRQGSRVLEARRFMPFTRAALGGGQLLTLFNGHRLADLLKIKHRKSLQNLLLLRSFFQKAFLDHPRQIRRGQFLETSPWCSRLARTRV